MDRSKVRPGRIRPAPENFLDADSLDAIRRGQIDEDRRSFIRKSFLAATAAMAAPAAMAAGDGDEHILNLPPWSKKLGYPVAHNPYGQPSKYESNLVRRTSPGLAATDQANVAFSPLQGMFGIITASGLHFERHHQGWVDIDPAKHRLMINGLVDKPRVYTMDDLMRLPSVSRIHFVECGANSAMEWGNAAVPTVQYTHGMLSGNEYTGVLLSTLLEDAGFDEKKAKYLLAEGADGSSMTRTIDIERALDDAMVAYGSNGEMLRPENGYPLRLVVPGVQGVSWVKWLRRLEVGDQPYATKDETSHYVDLMPDGMQRQYTSIHEAKSVITTPSGGQKLLTQGYYNVSGLAWTGRGHIKRVDVSVDGGRNWHTARLEEPVLPKALTRFNIDWVWDGGPAILQSRAIDSTGFVQPTYSQLRDARGSRSIYHNNAIQSWQVSENGEVANVHVG
ncbi:sulfite dehydrogenase [Salinisphaera sp. P385]|uniref:Sulfite dehydrogenase n=1 Tax=Spectribacter acetivorans TaxID=3075603 RepID=A0ABU3B5M5_9GAMM|nr:sulfite dehydrogenase [Salinisphaera sp. P385]MDT0617754.1 sulfite dehydrogenase [Salinisphaera sp. P385]